MSFWASLYGSASGMIAQSHATNNISENIANMTTVGYKRTDTEFFETLANANRATMDRSAPGGTRAVDVQRIAQQGAIQQTESDTDLSIIGDGFFSVREGGDPAVNTQVYYTRNGVFNENANGILQNSAGYSLYGVTTDQNGVAAGDVTDPSSYVPIDLSIIETSVLATSAAQIDINLDSNETQVDPHTLNPAQNLPVTNTTADYSRSLTVFDGNGQARQLIFEFRSIVGPMSHFTSDMGVPLSRSDVLVDDPTGITPGISNGDIFQIDDGTNTLDITFVNTSANTAANEANTTQDVLDVINNYTGAGTTRLYEASLTSEGRLLVQAIDPAVTLDISGTSASVRGTSGFDFILDPSGAVFSYPPEASLTTPGVANPDQDIFPAFNNTTDPNVHNWWELSIKTIDPANPTGTAEVEIRRGLLNFDASGSLNAVSDANGQSILDLSATTIDFDNTITGEEIGMTVDIGNFTQFAGAYTVAFADQNGAEFGTRQSTRIDNAGLVYSTFSNGIEIPLYQIPLVTFNNPDGLQRVSGTAFLETADSGTAAGGVPNSGGFGSIQAASLESSNVDVSEEFGNLIVSQRAYSLNGQVITAVSEMTENLARLKS